MAQGRISFPLVSFKCLLTWLALFTERSEAVSLRGLRAQSSPEIHTPSILSAPINSSEIGPVPQKSLDFLVRFITSLFYQWPMLKLLTLKMTFWICLYRAYQKLFSCLLFIPFCFSPLQWVSVKVLTASIKLPSWPSLSSSSKECLERTPIVGRC